MKQHSLIRRVVVVVLVVEVLCACCFAGVALWHEWRTRVQAMDALLQGRSDSLLGAVQDAEDPGDNVFVDPTELRLPREDAYSVYNQDGALLGGNERAVFPLTQRKGDGFRSVQVHHRHYRVLEREAMRVIDRSETGGTGIRRPVTIVYAIPVSTAHIWHEILEAASFYIAASAGFAALTVLVLLVLLGRLLRPVEELAVAAGEVSPAKLTFAAPRSATRVKELAPLADALSSSIAGLQRAFEKQHRFVSDAAHELKTAVAVVRSTVQVLALRSRTVHEYQDGLESILKDNERVEELVSRMLLLAHVEEAPQHTTEPIDLAETANRATKALRSYATARNVPLSASFAKGVTVNVPAEELRTVATNLILNAIQHSAEGCGVDVRVFQDAEQALAVMEVEDHGHGIAERDLPFVFDRFYRADSSRSRETGGAGLGLAICKNIVEAAGGRIELASVLGQGTRVRVCLPWP
jgi:signal transduction histidine kinase